MPGRLGGITVHHIGGEETWKDLVAAYGSGERAVSTVEAQAVQETASFSL
jgi:hypothetical protein